MKSHPDLLSPRPQQLESTDQTFVLPGRVTLHVPDGATAAGTRLRGLLEGRGLAIADTEPAKADVRFRLDPIVSSDDEGYRLDVGVDGIDLSAATPAGLFYAAVTLGQWLELHPSESGETRLPGVRIRDRPDFAVRGVMLDVSRDKVPRLATLLKLADLLAGFKVNQLQLYTEHTFAYRGHEDVWRDANPLTPEDIRRLDAHCAERFIDLVPNQQSFGHFHRWLVHEPYRALAECPDGVDHPFAFVPEPFSLCPLDPGSLALLEDLYGQLLPSFRGAMINTGLDETLDLGQGRSRQACEERGRERVYLGFLQKVHALAARHGRRMQFWGDIIVKHPALLSELPEDVIALEWGYEHDHPFAEDARRFAASGRDFYVCPGTSAWSSFGGRTQNALLNLANAAVNGHAHGAAGYLVTDWGDHGHLQPLPVSYPGLLAGAAFAWNVETAKAPLEFPVAELLDRHVFRDRAGVLGRAVTALGNTYLVPGPPPMNGSALFFLVVFALLERERARITGLSVEGLEKTLEHIADAVSSLGQARPEYGDAALLDRELSWTADVMSFACRLGRSRLRSGRMDTMGAIPRRERADLARTLGELVERHREVVLERHRPGGLELSAARLERVRWLLVDHPD